MPESYPRNMCLLVKYFISSPVFNIWLSVLEWDIYIYAKKCYPPIQKWSYRREFLPSQTDVLILCMMEACIMNPILKVLLNVFIIFIKLLINKHTV